MKLVVCCLLFGYGILAQGIKNDEATLRSSLLANYDPIADPRETSSSPPIQLNLQFQVVNIDVDEAKHAMVTLAWPFFSWVDPRLTWDKTKYNGLERIKLDQNEVWVPKLRVYNDASKEANEKTRSVSILGSSNGSMLWVPPVVYESFCKLNYLGWPLDTQVCRIKLGDWVLNANEMEIASYSASFDIVDFGREIDTWTLDSHFEEKETKYYDCCPEPYVSANYAFTITRNSPTLAVVTIGPAVALSLLILLQMFLPNNHSGRLLIGSSAALITVIELLYIKCQIPDQSANTPFIVMYYTMLLLLTIMSLVTTFVSIRKLNTGNFK